MYWELAEGGVNDFIDQFYSLLLDSLLGCGFKYCRSWGGVYPGVFIDVYTRS